MAVFFKFGGEKKKEKTSSNTVENFQENEEKRTRLEIDDAAIEKIISDVLSGPEGLASIFAGEQTSGIFNSSVAAQAAGDLATKLIGEIAKLRAEEVSTLDKSGAKTTNIKTTGKSSGLSFSLGSQEEA